MNLRREITHFTMEPGTTPGMPHRLLENTTASGENTDSATGTNTDAHTFIYITEAYVQPILLCLAFLANVINLVVLRKLKMTKLFRTMLIALALSDLLCSFFGLIQLILEIAFYGGDIPFGKWELKAVTNYALYFQYLVFMCTSATIVVMMAIVRNLLVTQPLQSKKYLSSGRIKFFCFLAFFLTELLYLPTALNVMWQGCYESMNETDVCIKLYADVPKIEIVANRYLFALSILYGPIQVLVNIICLISIRISLGKSKKILRTMTRSGSRASTEMMKRRTDMNSRFTRTLFAILILDIVCILPTIILGVGLILAPTMIVFDKNHWASSLLDVIGEVFLDFRPFYNFWVYCFTQKDFRTCCFKLLGLTWCCKDKLDLYTDTQPLSLSEQNGSRVSWNTNMCDSPTNYSNDVNPLTEPTNTNLNNTHI